MYDELTNCAEITSSVTSFLSSEGVAKVGVTVVAATFEVAGFDAKLPILIGGFSQNATLTIRSSHQTCDFLTDSIDTQTRLDCDVYF